MHLHPGAYYHFPIQRLSPQAEVLVTTPQVLGTEPQVLGTEPPTQLGKLVVLRPPTLASASVLISSTTSLVQRKAVPGRSGVEWSSVTVVSSVESRSPFVQCNFCGVQYCATAARIKNHILGSNHSKPCSGSTEAFFAVKEKITPAAIEAASNKKAKLVESQMNVVSSSALTSPPTSGRAQSSIMQAFAYATTKTIDDALADCIFGDNLSFRLVESPHFKKLLAAMRSAPPSYKIPTRQRLGGVSALSQSYLTH